MDTAELEQRCPIEEKASALAVPELAAVSCYRDWFDVKRAAAWQETCLICWNR